MDRRLLAGAALLWALEQLRAWRAGERLRLEPWHVALAAFLVLGALSAVWPRTTGATGS